MVLSWRHRAALCSFDPHEVQLSHAEPMQAITRSENHWLVGRLYPMSVRRHLAARMSLFEPGDPARHYYLVESGKLLIHCACPGRKSAEHIARDGALLIYDCDGTHVVSCQAVDATTVLAISRDRLERAAQRDALLAGTIRSVHASEIEMILKGLGVSGEHRSKKTAPMCAHTTRRG
ncbi:MAG: cyclic nucleotide-binding domain-containing protein [Hyphomicrobiaceae bacterium]|nr:cyclic nucleotide-binding domain-containing protein [Hyphomicrobiaceae bacterium]